MSTRGNEAHQAVATERARRAGDAEIYPHYPEGLPDFVQETQQYRLRCARSAADLDAVLRLRFEVFNLELQEGLVASYATGRDEDAFDRQCHHLLVEDRLTGAVIGTYRLQTAAMAEAGGGFYTDTEFDLAHLPATTLAEGVELGRACIARAHRGRAVLFLLWRGLAAYVMHNRKRFLFGCCSLTSQNPADGWAALALLERRDRMWTHLHVPGRPGFECEPVSEVIPATSLPPLFDIYLRYGGKVASPPVIDRAFGTIDFLVLFDIEAMDPRTHRFFFGDRSPD